MPLTRLPIVGVMGSGEHEHAECAEPLGRSLADLGVHLLTGGGHGVMTSVSRAFVDVPSRRGLVLGIVPGTGDEATYTPRRGYPNLWVEVPIFTHLHRTGDQGGDRQSRNHINILSSHVIIALPGSMGTRSEVLLALRYHRPLVAHLTDRSQIPQLPSSVYVEPKLGSVIAFVQSHLGTDS